MIEDLEGCSVALASSVVAYLRYYFVDQSVDFVAYSQYLLASPSTAAVAFEFAE